MPDPSLSSDPAIAAVPVEQRPLSQYQELLQSWFFGWPTHSLGAYVRGVIYSWAAFLLFCSPLAAASFSLPQSWLPFVLVTFLGANFLLLIVLLRLDLGWLYVRQRLHQSQILYEETGWYDTAMYRKTAAEITRHRLIVQHEIGPILQRLHRTFACIGLTSLLCVLIWYGIK